MNWTSLAINDLKDAAHGAIIDAAQSTATGSDDPVASTIADVIARIRAAISSGNQLDQDKTKIPNSLKDLAARMCVRRLKARIGMALDPDEKDQRKEDNDYLKQISDDKVRFETPDSPGGEAEMQSQPSIKIGQTNKETLESIPGADTHRVSSRDRLRNL